MNKPTILYGILNWGLGHAARSIPLIESLAVKYNVIIIASGESCHFLKNNLNQHNITLIETPDYSIHYYKYMPAWGSVITQLPKLFAIKNMHLKLAANFVDKYHPVAIISDSLFGFSHNKIPSILISHQLHLPYNFIYNRLIKQLNKLYDYIWIPDSPRNPLSGLLSKTEGYSQKVSYIGVLSRFQKIKSNIQSGENKQALIILSGPEPMRSYFLEYTLKKTKKKYDTIIVAGHTKYQNKTIENPNVTYKGTLNIPAMASLISGCDTIISRNGYTTLMDLCVLQKKAILIPTPGQPEQKYLAKYFVKKGWAAPANYFRNGIEITQWPDVEYFDGKIPRFE